MNQKDVGYNVAFPGGSDGKVSAYNAGDLGSIPGEGRSPGEGNGNPLQYSCLENPMDGGTWQAIVHGCRGPAPVDPGNSKGGRRWRGKTCLFIDIRLD